MDQEHRKRPIGILIPQGREADPLHPHTRASAERGAIQAENRMENMNVFSRVFQPEGSHGVRFHSRAAVFLAVQLNHDFAPGNNHALRRVNGE